MFILGVEFLAKISPYVEKTRLWRTLSRFLISNYVISTEGINHTCNSTKIADLDYGVSIVISPFGRNDKLDGCFAFVLIFFADFLAKICFACSLSLESPSVEMANIVVTLRGLRLRSA